DSDRGAYCNVRRSEWQARSGGVGVVRLIIENSHDTPNIFLSHKNENRRRGGRDMELLSGGLWTWKCEWGGMG
ncbi:MAG: hypothetical protein OXG25_00060, partial [Gammaproteobacteria bacterium]|nr:hypothetical protein [Gammaproteobacteria bacterium]